MHFNVDTQCNHPGYPTSDLIFTGPGFEPTRKERHVAEVDASNQLDIRSSLLIEASYRRSVTHMKALGTSKKKCGNKDLIDVAMYELTEIHSWRICK